MFVHVSLCSLERESAHSKVNTVEVSGSTLEHGLSRSNMVVRGNFTVVPADFTRGRVKSAGHRTNMVVLENDDCHAQTCSSRPANFQVSEGQGTYLLSETLSNSFLQVLLQNLLDLVKEAVVLWAWAPCLRRMPAWPSSRLLSPDFSSDSKVRGLHLNHFKYIYY